MKKEYYNLPQWKEFKKTGEPVKYCEFCRKREKLVKEDEFGMGK